MCDLLNYSSQSTVTYLIHTKLLSYETMVHICIQYKFAIYFVRQNPLVYLILTLHVSFIDVVMQVKIVNLWRHTVLLLMVGRIAVCNFHTFGVLEVKIASLEWCGWFN